MIQFLPFLSSYFHISMIKILTFNILNIFAKKPQIFDLIFQMDFTFTYDWLEFQKTWTIRAPIKTHPLYLVDREFFNDGESLIPDPRIVRIHLGRSSTSARFWKKPTNIHLVQNYSTSVNKKSCVLNKNSLSVKFALTELNSQSFIKLTLSEYSLSAKFTYSTFSQSQKSHYARTRCVPI